jgi:acetoin utilization protein AcuB
MASGSGTTRQRGRREWYSCAMSCPTSRRWSPRDLLVLSVGVEAAEESTLALALGVSLDGDGFFREEHPKMKPLDLGKQGMFVAGLAHSPRFLEESLAQGQGAAMRAAAYLAPGTVAERATSVWVNPRLCSFCGLCVEACPYSARVMNFDTRVADVAYTLCQGCGVCAVVCPNKATLRDVHHLPVIDEKDALVGMISEKDLLRAKCEDLVKTVMTSEVVTVTEYTEMEEAARIMLDRQISSLPVMRAGRMVGIITQTDLFNIFLELLGAKEKGVRLTMLIPEEKGMLASVTREIANLGGNILALGTFLGEDPTNRMVTVKVADVPREQLVAIMEALGMEIVDVREG